MALDSRHRTHFLEADRAMRENPRVALVDFNLRLQRLIVFVFDLGMRIVGPLMLTGGLSLIMVITYLYYFHVSPQLFPRWSLPWVAVSLVGLWLLFNILWNYLHCAFTHPGSPPEVDEEEASFAMVDAADDGASTLGRQCKQCQKYKPDRAHHCRVCKTCILRMDHHCPWMNNCIGFYNYRYFVLFLVYLWLGCLFAITVSMKPFLGSFRNGPLPYVRLDQTTKSAVSFSLIMCLSIGLAITMLLGWHLYLVATAQTTIEFYQRSQQAMRSRRRRQRIFVNEFDLGIKRNFEAVFGVDSLPMRWMMPSRRAPPGDGLSYPTCRSLGLFDRRNTPSHVL